MIANTFERQVYFWTHMLDEALGVPSSRSAAASKRMGQARKSKYDEFYTSYEDAEKLLLPFKKHLRGKKILMPCDNPDKSQMFKWVFDHFSDLGLASLSCVGYGCSDMLVMDQPDDFQMVPVANNGDFTRGESLEALEACDVVIGNPPFSQGLGVQFLLQPVQHGKDVIGIETPEKCTYGALKEAVLSQTLTVYEVPYQNFSVPISTSSSGEVKRAETDTGVYVRGKVQVYAFSTFHDVHELKRKLAPFFYKGYQLGVRWSDLPDAPHGPRADRTDIKVMYDRDTGSHTHFTWLPPKPESDGITKPMLAISCYQILGCNWERYFKLEKMVNVAGMLVDPWTGEDLKAIDTKFFVFSYK